MKKAGSEQMEESKSISFWQIKPCIASRNLMYTANLFVYICPLCTRFVASCTPGSPVFVSLFTQYNDAKG